MKIIIRVGIFLLSIGRLFAQQNTIYGTGTNNNGAGNAMYGYYAGHVNTGSSNTFIGQNSGLANTTGSSNCFIGSGSGAYNTTGSRNTILGSGSGEYNTGSDNTFIGYWSGLLNTSGTDNTFVGQNSGYGNTTASGNVALGGGALLFNKTGNYNTAIGNYAGQSSKGTGNVFLGYQAGFNETGSNKLYLSNSSTSTPLIYGDFSSKQVGINTLPGSYTLNVGGTLNASAVYVNGTLISGDSYWTKSGSNIYTMGLKMGIGTSLANNPNNYTFAVNGKIGAQEVQIENTSSTWPEFVFKDDYKLRPLREVESFIIDNGHLPEIPSEKQVKEEGIKLAEMNALLLQKIEELTLYMIEANKKIESLEAQVKNLQK